MGHERLINNNKKGDIIMHEYVDEAKGFLAKLEKAENGFYQKENERMRNEISKLNEENFGLKQELQNTKIELAVRKMIIGLTFGISTGYVLLNTAAVLMTKIASRKLNDPKEALAFLIIFVAFGYIFKLAFSELGSKELK